ncbi:hypothetical protein GCM10009557_29820 [Virgisporangium ochraceum]|uniref:Novel STAND NTPase 1 domain-containing protein n=1 Tax=Virgisporangium ochraceum TaxID=65505 RepID=A0A8J4A152_9ACTN|nr:hypothetical protein Voc01_078050 [Virgisporangium ochraceum]
MAQIVDPNGTVVGAGFLITPDLVATCAHVVVAADAAPGGHVQVRMLRPGHDDGLLPARASVEVDGWRDSSAEDVALLRLERPVTDVPTATLGAAAACRGRSVAAFGFPAQGQPNGQHARATGGDLVPTGTAAGTLLQLHDANDLTVGFSGGPVFDEASGVVVGMLTEIIGADQHLRGTAVAFATRAEVLREVVASLAPGLAHDAPCPYRGLQPFTEEHVRWFHGRDDAIERVIDALRRSRLVVLLGPSGAGKSSLVRAGVLPAVRAGGIAGGAQWIQVVARPGRDLRSELRQAGLPAAAGEQSLAAAVSARLSGRESTQASEAGAMATTAAGLLLVVDQFEELLVQAPAEDRVGASPTGVHGDLLAALDAVPALRLVLIVRDDFYPQLAAQAPALLRRATSGLVNVPATLNRRQLRDIIVRPAEQAGLHVPDALVEQIITDVLAVDPMGPSDHAPVTVLPLVELALEQLWHRRVAGALTSTAYREIGGVTGGMTTWCETVLHGLADAQRRAVRGVLIALVRPADPDFAVPAVRRSVPVEALEELVPDANNVLQALVAARIVTTRTALPTETQPHPGPVAELVHEALIRDWPALREWVATDRLFQDWLDRADQHARRWSRGRSADDLLRGSTLEEGLTWWEQRPLPGPVTELLAASRTARRRSARRVQAVIAALVGLLAVAVVVGSLALWQRQVAVTAQQAAESRQLAAESASLAESQPDLSALLAAEAFEHAATAEAATSLVVAANRGLLRTLRGHSDTVWCLAYRPDGRTLVTGSWDGTARLWDVATGTLLTTYTGHNDRITAVAVAADGRWVATSSDDGTTRLWSAATGETIAIVGAPPSDAAVPHRVNHVTFSPSGDLIATTGDDRAIRLWRVPDGRPAGALTGHLTSTNLVVFSPDGATLMSTSNGSPVYLWDVAGARSIGSLNGHTARVRTAAFGPDGETAVTGSDDGTARLWNLRTGAVIATLVGHGAPVITAAISPNGSLLATGGDDGTARLWNVRTGTAVATLTGHRAPVNTLAFSPDSAVLATGSRDHTVRLWTSSGGRPVAALAGHHGDVTALAFGPDGSTLASAGADHTVRLWTPTAGRPTRTFVGHTGVVSTAAYGTDGRVAVSAGADRTARIWDLTSGRPGPVLTGHTDAVGVVAISPDSRTVATAGSDGTTRLWDVNSGRAGPVLTGHHGAVTGVTFTADGRSVLTAGADGTARLWEATSGRPGPVLAGHTDRIRSLALSPDGRAAVTAGSDGLTRLWRVPGGDLMLTLSGPDGEVTSTAFSPDGRMIATAYLTGAVHVWSIHDGRIILTLHDPSGRGAAPSAVTFSPDSRFLASAGSDGSARLWSLPAGHAAATLTGHTAPLSSAVFSPDGQILATGSADGTVRLWDLETYAEIARFDGASDPNRTVAFSPDSRHVFAAYTSTKLALWPVPVRGLQALAGLCTAVGRQLSREERTLHVPTRRGRAAACRREG